LNVHKPIVEGYKKQIVMNNENKKIFHPETIITAPFRSGKGVSCAIPTALSHPDTIIVLDFKGEIFSRDPQLKKLYQYTHSRHR